VFDVHVEIFTDLFGHEILPTDGLTFSGLRRQVFDKRQKRVLSLSSKSVWTQTKGAPLLAHTDGGEPLKPPKGIG
jgi:hypothetical protein